MRISNTFGAQPQVMEAAPVAAVQEVRNENQFFDFEKAKVQTLTLEQLKRTNIENRGDDRSKPHGIYDFELIQQVLDLAAQHGYDAEVYDLFATNNRDKQANGVSLFPELEAKYGERAIEAHALRRVYANVRLKNFDTPELTTNLAISYTQKGIQVGFGSMVKVCHNQNIMGSGQFVSDYSTGAFRYAKGSKEKTNLEGIMQTIGGWLTSAEHIFITEQETIERMKHSVLTAEQIYTVLGILVTLRVTYDTENKKIRNQQNGVYPLNGMQINKFTELLLLKQKEQGMITAWDFYNSATELYKPTIVDQNMILPQVQRMNQFMQEYELYV